MHSSRMMYRADEDIREEDASDTSDEKQDDLSVDRQDGLGDIQAEVSLKGSRPLQCRSSMGSTDMRRSAAVLPAMRALVDGIMPAIRTPASERPSVESDAKNQDVTFKAAFMKQRAATLTDLNDPIQMEPPRSKAGAFLLGVLAKSRAATTSNVIDANLYHTKGPVAVTASYVNESNQRGSPLRAKFLSAVQKVKTTKNTRSENEAPTPEVTPLVMTHEYSLLGSLSGKTSKELVEAMKVHRQELSCQNELLLEIHKRLDPHQDYASPCPVSKELIDAGILEEIVMAMQEFRFQSMLQTRAVQILTALAEASELYAFMMSIMDLDTILRKSTAVNIESERLQIMIASLCHTLAESRTPANLKAYRFLQNEKVKAKRADYKNTVALEVPGRVKAQAHSAPPTQTYKLTHSASRPTEIAASLHTPSGNEVEHMETLDKSLRLSPSRTKPLTLNNHYELLVGNKVVSNDQLPTSRRRTLSESGRNTSRRASDTLLSFANSTANTIKEFYVPEVKPAKLQVLSSKDIQAVYTSPVAVIDGKPIIIRRKTPRDVRATLSRDDAVGAECTSNKKEASRLHSVQTDNEDKINAVNKRAERTKTMGADIASSNVKELITRVEPSTMKGCVRPSTCREEVEAVMSTQTSVNDSLNGQSGGLVVDFKSFDKRARRLEDRRKHSANVLGGQNRTIDGRPHGRHDMNMISSNLRGGSDLLNKSEVNNCRMKKHEAVIAKIRKRYAKGLDYHKRGHLALALGCYDDALRSWEEHVLRFGSRDELREECAALHLNRGGVLLKQKKSEMALRAFKRSLQLQPGNTKTIYNIGLTLVHMSKYEQACQQFRRVLALQPSHSKAQLALTHLETGYSA